MAQQMIQHCNRRLVNAVITLLTLFLFVLCIKIGHVMLEEVSHVMEKQAIWISQRYMIAL